MPGIAELLIYDVIGYDWWTDGGVTAAQVVNFLAEQDDDAEIHVRINSPGGDAFDGVAIYNALARDSRRVIVWVDGLAASAASVVAMAGDQIHMAANALMMIHDAWTITLGTAADHEAAAEMLHRVDGALAKTYAARTGAAQSDVQEWMDDETWMDADEAKERGFADVVDEAKQAEASWGRGGQRVLASFKNKPDHLSPAPQQRPQRIAAQAVQEQPMDLKKICAALGLPEDAQDDTILAAIEARGEVLATDNIALAAVIPAVTPIEPDPVAYVPRADFDALRSRVEAADKATLSRDIEDAIKAAEGKLVFSDADRERFRKHLESGGMSIAAFREEIAAREMSPLAIPDEVTARTSATDQHGLTHVEKELCARTGLDPEKFAANKAKRAGRLEVA